MQKRKVIGAVLGFIFFCLTIIVSTFAFYTWKSGNTDVTFNIGDSYFYCESGQTINQTGLSPVLDYRKSSYHTFKVNNIGKADTKFSVTLNIKSIDDALKSTSFKYKLVVDKTGGSNNCVTGSGCEEVSGGSGNFSKMKVGMNTIAPSIDLPNNTRYQYYLFMYIDGNMANSTAMQTSKIESVLEVCEIIATLDYNYGNVVDNKEYLKVSATYAGLPETVTRNTTTITYNSQGGSNVASHHITYAFGGWYLENTYKNRVTASSKVNTTINHTLFAKWNATWTEKGSNTNTTGVILPTTTRTGYTFQGWYTAATGGTKVGMNGGNYNTETSQALYAQWAANPLNFSNQKITKTYSTSAQTASITPATNGTGSYTYTEVSEKNASGTSTNYISISGTTINIAASTPAGTYSYVIRASDNNSKVTKDATYTIIINRANTATTGSCKNPTYNGASQTLAGSGSYVSYGNNSGTNATSYTVSVTADSNHTFSDGTTSKTLSCSIGKRATTCTSGSSNKVWNGSALTNKTGGSCTNLVSGHAATFSGHTGSITNVGSTSNGFGSVVIRINATTMDVTGNYSITKKNGTLTVTKANTAATGSCKSLTYSGSAQTLASGGSYVSYGNNSGTNAGSYTVNVTADSNHTFSDGTTSKTLSCSIGKATPTITLSATSGTITGSTLTFTEKANVAGKFTNTSGNTGIATVSPASNSSAISANTDQTVTVTAVSTGSSSITVNFSPTDTTNYNNASAKTYTVTVKNQYTITYNNNGGSGCTTKNNVSAGKAIGALCTPSWTGHTFQGWFTAASGGTQVTSSTIMGTSNMTVYAHWSAKQIKIKYDANGGSGKMYTTVYTYSNDGSYVNFSTNTFTKTGHTFAGWHIKDDDTGLYFGCTDTSKCTYGVSSGLDWYNSSQSGFKYFTPGTDGIWKISRGETENDVTAIAQWTPNKYTVTYNGNMFFTTSQTSGGINVTYDYNNSYITLNGTASSQVGIDFGLFGETLSQNLQFKTTLTYVSGSYSGSGCIATEIRKADGGSLSTRNWVDVGFPTSGSSSGVLTVSATAASEGSRVYSWLYLNSGFVFNNYKIKINITKLYTKSVTYASTYGTSYTPVRIGHTFAGWYTAESGGTAVSSTTTVTNPSNHTLYAHWSANTYTVSYNANGGTGAPSAQSFVFNSDTRISTTKPTRVGYTFLNWIYGGVGLNPGAAIPKGWGNFTLTANWSRNFTCAAPGFMMKQLLS